MGIGKYLKKYKEYEAREMARRSEKKKKIAPYKHLAEKSKVKAKAVVAKNLAEKKFRTAIPKGKLSARAYTEAIGNPYGVKYPKAKRTLKKIKK